MRRIIYLFMLLASCRQLTRENLPSETIVLTGILTGGESIEGINFFYFDETGVTKNINNAQLHVRNEALSSPLIFNGENYYALDQIPVTPGERYTISGSYQGSQIEANIHIPPSISLIGNLTSDTIEIDTDPLPSVSLAFAWTELQADSFSYVLALENLEKNPVLIPFEVEPQGSFEQTFAGPQEQAGAIIFETDFRYYGLHKLTVFAVPKAMEEVYFFEPTDLRGLIVNGPDNVEGARGFVAGVSKFSIEFVVE